MQRENSAEFHTREAAGTVLEWPSVEADLRVPSHEPGNKHLLHCELN